MFGKLGNEALRSAEASSAALGSIIDNISNMKSLGHKKSDVTFVEALNGEIVKYQSKDFSQGPLKKTAAPFDLGIEGKGFFEIELPSGQRAYTRIGLFGLSSEGELITKEGYRVLPGVEQTLIAKKSVVKSNNTDKSIKVNDVGMNLTVSTPKLIVPPHLTPEITQDGTVYGISQETGEKTRLGRISLITFNNPNGLEYIGKGYHTETSSSGKAIEISAGMNFPTRVKQGFVESSNVNVASEFMNLTQMKNLITAQLKVLKAIDKIYENVHFTISRAV